MDVSFGSLSKTKMLKTIQDLNSSSATSISQNYENIFDADNMKEKIKDFLKSQNSSSAEDDAFLQYVDEKENKSDLTETKNRPKMQLNPNWQKSRIGTKSDGSSDSLENLRAIKNEDGVFEFVYKVDIVQDKTGWYTAQKPDTKEWAEYEKELEKALAEYDKQNQVDYLARCLRTIDDGIAAGEKRQQFIEAFTNKYKAENPEFAKQYDGYKAASDIANEKNAENLEKENKDVLRKATEICQREIKK